MSVWHRPRAGGSGRGGAPRARTRDQRSGPGAYTVPGPRRRSTGGRWRGSGAPREHAHRSCPSSATSTAKLSRLLRMAPGCSRRESPLPSPASSCETGPATPPPNETRLCTTVRSNTLTATVEPRHCARKTRPKPPLPSSSPSITSDASTSAACHSRPPAPPTAAVRLMRDECALELPAEPSAFAGPWPAESAAPSVAGWQQHRRAAASDRHCG